MKKILTVLMLAMAITASAQQQQQQQQNEVKKMTKKTLIVYYSHSGNTKTIAERIEKACGADIARIETVKAYTGTEDEVSAQGQREVNSKFKPEIKPLSVDVKDYDLIIIGTPTWWYTMAPAVLTFLSANDFSGKTVVPFMTNAGWPGHVIKDMKAACKGATFAHEMEIKFSANAGSRNQMDTPENEVAAWIESLKTLTK